MTQFVDELNADTGVVLQSLVVNATAGGASCAADSSQLHQGLLSTGGGFAFVSCYNVTPGTPAAGSRRVIAIIAPNGTVDTSTVLGPSTFPSSGFVSGAASPDGTNIWVGGFDNAGAYSGRLAHVIRGHTNASAQDASVVSIYGGVRKPLVFGGQLYALLTPPYWGYTYHGPMQVGTGTPTGDPTWLTNSALAPLPGLGNVYTSWAPTAFQFQDAATLWLTGESLSL